MNESTNLPTATSNLRGAILHSMHRSPRLEIDTAITLARVRLSVDLPPEFRPRRELKLSETGDNKDTRWLCCFFFFKLTRVKCC